MVLGKVDSHIKSNETEPLYYLIHKVNSKWIEDLNVRPETKNLLELKIGNKLLGDDILDLTPKAKEIRKKVGLHQTKKPLNSKGNHQQNKKVTYWMGENIFKLYTWYEVNMQNI